MYIVVKNFFGYFFLKVFIVDFFIIIKKFFFMGKFFIRENDLRCIFGV